MSCDPSPGFPTMDSAYLGLSNTEDLGNSFFGLNPGKGTYGDDFGLGNFRTPVPLTDSLGPVDLHVGHIFGVRFPSNVLLGHTPQMAVAACMSGLMLGSWTGALYMLANKRMDVLHATIDADGAITLTSFAEGPKKAIVALICQHDFIEIALSLAGLGSARTKRAPGFR